MFTLIDEGAIAPWDTVATGADDQQWIKSFYPAFMQNSQTGGKTWGIPFQRSTVVLYWNKETFKEAGLDPNRAPANWKEMVDYAQKLTKRDASGKVSQWGVQVPSSGFPYWLFQGFTTQTIPAVGRTRRSRQPRDDRGAAVLAGPVAQVQHHAMASSMGHHPKDFFERKIAMIGPPQHLTNEGQYPFDFGVAMLPGGRRCGTPRAELLPVQVTPRAEAALGSESVTAWRGRMGIATGYVAVRPDAWDTPEMKKYVEGFPAAAVARDQLQYAVAELSTYDNQRVTKALNDGLQAALTGGKSPEAAMKDAQREAERLLRSYRRK